MPVCLVPTAVPDSPVPAADGRVRSGALSFPQLTAPFGAPTRTTLLRFSSLTDAASQLATLRYDGRPTGGAEVMVAGLPLIDGFETTEKAAELVSGCVRQRFPGAAQDGPTNLSTSVDGHPGSLVRTHYSYGEVEAGVRSGTVLVLVVALDEGTNGVFYAYLPDTHPELVPRTERAMEQLEVG